MSELSERQLSAGGEFLAECELVGLREGEFALFDVDCALSVSIDNRGNNVSHVVECLHAHGFELLSGLLAQLF